MTLAALLLFSFSWLTLAPPLGGGLAHQPGPATSAARQETQDQAKSKATGTQPAAQPPIPPSPAKSKSAPAKKRSHKKKLANSDCNASPAVSQPPGSVSTSSHPVDPSIPKSAEQNSATLAAPKNCPPPKIIVRQGGTAEPSIQLAGGPTADEAARKRDAVNQLLGVTDQNLKKTAGRQLSASEQDMITQARQYMDQSKAAIVDGDLERARTLAWKAELLSEDLLKPQP